MAKKPMKKRNALGRGLGALLEDSPARESTEKQFEAPSNVGSINEIKVEHIETNPFQPRTHFDQTALQELSDSIKVQGIIQPITVRKLSADKYQLISGERRFQASKLAGLEKVPAYIRTADDQQMLEMALIENIQRENLNAIEIALSYQRLLSECELKQEELGDRVGKNRTTVNNYLRLLKLPPDIQAALRDKKISMGHARALITIENVDLQLDIFKKIIAEDLSVRKVEELVRQSLNSAQKEKAPKEEPENGKEIVQLQSKLTSHFGTKVQVKSDGKKGEIKIPFLSIDDLNRILDILEV
ncbi:ParB/RepB/Spo0J family partition protein [Fulvivirga ligni]|uniref:ParB/RepB/Spo0J family partition protein n=1 Tax=Fulvivirga ligni TaxID=2904246 RepID=UPI001F3466F6|nr:ParB/RepB/Spo0J family partition protein [Fulvivirga ligni]UII20024.1 ParB/RepB/Spo0J family partition protein [Fulvivirga ligni]